MTPEVALEMSKKILGGLKAPAPTELTVGDLSVVNEPKRKNRVKDGQRYLRNREKGLTVGDISKVTDEKPDEPRLDNLFVGPATPEPSTCESQEVLMEMQADMREKREDIRRICSLAAGGKDELLENYVAKYLKKA